MFNQIIFLRERVLHLPKIRYYVSLWYTVDRAEKDWKYSEGFITKAMVEEHLMFDSDAPTQFFLCGPPPMIKFACTPALKELGYSEKDWVVF